MLEGALVEAGLKQGAYRADKARAYKAERALEKTTNFN